VVRSAGFHFAPLHFCFARGICPRNPRQSIPRSLTLQDTGFSNAHLSLRNFSVFKNNPIKRISDKFNVQFRAEFFNVLNHTNFAPPLDNRNIFDSSGNPIGNAGLITSTQTPSRQIQFALKLIW
jgi:hypothetical protein